MNLCLNLFKSKATLYVASFSLTLALAVTAIWHAGVVNSDGILYLRVADTWLTQGTHAALSQYSLAFYSIFIALTSQWLSVSLETSAYLLNIVFQIVITIYFIRIVEVLGGTRRTQWFALFVILFFPHLLDYRAFIIRDFGYWAGYLAGLFYVLSYCRMPSWRLCIMALLSLGCACLFRVEGLVFIGVVPCLFLLLPSLTRRQRIQGSVQFGVTTLAIIVFMLLVAYLTVGGVKPLFAQWHFVSQGFTVWVHSIQTKIHSVAHLVLDEQARRSASLIVTTGLVGYVVFDIVKVITPFYLLLAGFALYRGLIPALPSQRWLLGFFCLLNMLVITYFVGIFFFLSGRYLLPLAMLALLPVPFALDYLYLRVFAYHRKGKIIDKSLFCAGMLLLACIGLHNYMRTNTKGYLKDAGQWLAQHTTSSDRILTNSARVLFYAKGNGADWQKEYVQEVSQLSANKRTGFDYLALRVNKHNRKQTSTIMKGFAAREPSVVFENKAKERVVIYR